jgi:tetratricopeptide (TPR) repeat protein
VFNLAHASWSAKFVVSIDREKILQSAQKWVDKKRYDRAIEDYQKIVASDPNDARTLLKIGDLQTRMQAYPDAIATYDKVGNYYAKQGFALKAIAVFKQVRELVRKHSPDLADRYAHIVPRLAEIYTQLGLTSDALQAYDEVATQFQRTGRERDAIEVFRKMVALDGTNPLPHLRLAEARCRIQDLDDAVEAFWTAAELLLKLGRRDDALKVIERILHFKADPKFSRMAAELYLARGGREDGMQALAKLQVCFQANPKDLDTLGLLAQAFTLIDQPDKSLEVYKEMARTARDTGRQDLFQELLTHLTQVAPNDEQVRALAAAGPGAAAAPPARERSVSAVHVDDADLELIDEEEDAHVDDTAAEAPFELNRQSHPGFRPQQASAPDVVVVADDLQVAEELSAGDSLEAREHARKAVVDAESFRRLRLYSKALEVLHIALEVDPRSLDAREKLREILIESGDRDNAIGESITLAALYLEASDPSRAELMLYEVLEAEPNHPAALEMLQSMGGESTQAGMEWSSEAGTYEAAEYDPAAYDQQAYEQQQDYDRPSYDSQGYAQQDEQYPSDARYSRPSGGHPTYGEPGYEHFDESSNAVTYAPSPATTATIPKRRCLPTTWKRSARPVRWRARSRFRTTTACSTRRWIPLRTPAWTNPLGSSRCRRSHWASTSRALPGQRRRRLRNSIRLRYRCKPTRRSPPRSTPWRWKRPSKKPSSSWPGVCTKTRAPSSRISSTAPRGTHCCGNASAR